MSQLDAGVVAWLRSAESAGCVLSALPPPLEFNGFSLSVALTCTNVAVNVRVSGGDLRSASTTLGEFLRLLHAATARPVYSPRYDWLQQLLWPTVCTLPRCRCCRDGDRRITLQLSCATNESVPLLEVIYASLFDWTDDAAGIEFKELIAAIRKDAGGANPEAPLMLGVTVLPRSVRVTNATGYLTTARDLLAHLADAAVDWFQVDKVSATFAREPMRGFHEKVLKMLSASKLPLALSSVSPRDALCDTSVRDWLFLHPPPSPPLPMPVVLDLQIHFNPMAPVESPSARVFTQFAKWLATNNTLKVLTIEIPSHLSRSSPEAWESLGFALFSPFSKLRLHHLKLGIPGLHDDDINAMVAGRQQPCVENDEGGRVGDCPLRHEMLTLSSFRLTNATLLKFIRHFGCASRGLRVDVGDSAYPLHVVLDVVLNYCPALEELVILVFAWRTNRSIATEEPTVTTSIWSTPRFLVPPVRSFSLVDTSGTVAPHVIRQTLELFGHTLTHFTISGSIATGALADTIMKSCPVLKTVNVASAEASFWKHLSRGYASGDCKICDLTVGEETWTASGWLFDLVRRLSEPTLALTRTLQKLRLCGNYASSELAALQHAQLEMLDKNAFLVELSLPICAPQQREAARAKNGEIVANVSYPLHPRQQSALLSCSPRIASGLVPREIWRLVLDFSARPARRSVDMRM